MGKLSLPFYSRPFTRYVFLQGLLAASLFLLCISSMTDPDADHTMHNRAVSCNRTRVSEKDCAAASRALRKISGKEIIIWSHHLTLGVLSIFSGSIAILAWATHAKTWPCLERQRAVYWAAPFAVCLILLVQVFIALIFFLLIRVFYLWFSVMASALVLWDGYHFAASLQELLPEATQSSETPPSKRTPIKAQTPLKDKTPTIPRTPTAPRRATVLPKPLATVTPVKA